MRGVARRVGEHLSRTVGYLGAFGIDGIATAEGFRPTELNPRMSGGFMGLTGSMDFPIGLAARSMIEGDLEINVTEMEETVMEAASENRFLALGLPVPDSLGPAKIGVRFDDMGTAAAVDAEDEFAQGTMSAGPSVPGGYVFMSLDQDSLGVGPSMGPLALEGVRLAAREFHIDLPDVESAPDLTC